MASASQQTKWQTPPTVRQIRSTSRSLTLSMISRSKPPGVLAATHQAIRCFEKPPLSASGTFIYTDDQLNIAPIMLCPHLGMGRSATAHLLAFAARADQGEGYKLDTLVVSSIPNKAYGGTFYYADEQKADGLPAGGAIDGRAHAGYYVQLAEAETQRPWLGTFVEGSGYAEFPEQAVFALVYPFLPVVQDAP